MKKRDKVLAGVAVVTGIGTVAAILLFSFEADAADSVGTLGGTPMPKPAVPAAPKPKTVVPAAGTIPKPVVPAAGTLPTPAVPAAPTKKFNPDEHERPVPTHGFTYQVRYQDFFGGTNKSRSIAYRAIRSAGYEAAIEHGATVPEAQAFADQVAASGKNRAIYIQAIQCVAFNDLLYGTWGYGNKAKPALHGRAIRLMKYHADNRTRLIEGKPVVRNIKIGRYQTAGDKSGRPIDSEIASQFEYLLLPRINLAHLWATKEVQISGWRPAFDYEVQHYEDLPQSFGCAGGQEAFE